MWLDNRSPQCHNWHSSNESANAPSRGAPGSVPEIQSRRFGKTMKLRPLGDKVVVQLLEKEDKSAGGLYLPDSAQKKPQTGKVIAIGDGRLLEDGKRAPMTLKVGDKVLFSKYGGNEVQIDGEEYTILDEDQVYAVLN